MRQTTRIAVSSRKTRASPNSLPRKTAWPPVGDLQSVLSPLSFSLCPCPLLLNSFLYNDVSSKSGYPNVKKSAPNRKLRNRGFRIVALGGGTAFRPFSAASRNMVIRRTDEHATPEHTIADLAAIVRHRRRRAAPAACAARIASSHPGDIRNCMVALSKDEALLGRLFHTASTLVAVWSHNFRQSFLAALTHVTGDFTDHPREQQSPGHPRPHFPGQRFQTFIWSPPTRTPHRSTAKPRITAQPRADKENQTLFAPACAPSVGDGCHQARRPHPSWPRLALTPASVPIS